MNYGEVIALIEDKVNSYSGDLYFGIGTLKELNSQEDKNYPLVWVLTPVTIGHTIQNEVQVAKNYSITLRFLQSVSTTTTRTDADKMFAFLDNVMTGFIISVLNDIQESDAIEQPITFGTATQLYKVQDDIHIGWNLPVTINTYPDINACCLPYESE